MKHSILFLAFMEFKVTFYRKLQIQEMMDLSLRNKREKYAK